MRKIIRYIKFHIKTAFKNIFRHVGMTFSASIAVTITLILISVFMLMAFNISNFTHTIEDQVTIRASIDKIVKEDQQKALLSEIEKIQHVKKVTFSSGNEELDAYKKEYTEDQSLFSMYEGKSNPIRNTFIIEVDEAKNVSGVSDQITKLKGIVDAKFGGSGTSDMIRGFSSIRSGGFIFIAFLVIVAIFLISNTIKMSIYTRKGEIAIMRFVGASNWCVKFPMMLEGMLIGVIGSVIPIVLTVVGYQYIFTQMDGALLTNMLMLTSVFPLTIQISLFLLGIGVVVGLLGSFLSTTKYLRWKR